MSSGAVVEVIPGALDGVVFFVQDYRPLDRGTGLYSTVVGQSVPPEQDLYLQAYRYATDTLELVSDITGDVLVDAGINPPSMSASLFTTPTRLTLPDGRVLIVVTVEGVPDAPGCRSSFVISCIVSWDGTRLTRSPWVPLGQSATPWWDTPATNRIYSQGRFAMVGDKVVGLLGWRDESIAPPGINFPLALGAVLVTLDVADEPSLASWVELAPFELALGLNSPHSIAVAGRALGSMWFSTSGYMYVQVPLDDPAGYQVAPDTAVPSDLLAVGDAFYLMGVDLDTATVTSQTAGPSGFGAAQSVPVPVIPASGFTWELDLDLRVAGRCYLTSIAFSVDEAGAQTLVPVVAEVTVTGGVPVLGAFTASDVGFTRFAQLDDDFNDWSTWRTSSGFVGCTYFHVFQVFDTSIGPPLRLAQRDDGLGVAGAPPRLGGANGPASVQLGAAPRVGDKNTYS